MTASDTLTRTTPLSGRDNAVAACRRVMASRLGALAVLVASLIVYILTVEPTASYWDCPEYILVADGMQVGHPPGNPVWMLMAKTATLFAPSPEKTALAINLTSGLFTALAAMLLYLTAMRLLRPARGSESRMAFAARLVGSAAGAWMFAWCDTAWFSAVEAEVYASSIFCTALCVWLALKWSDHAFTARGDRLLILIAYITGLSIGVHQLNLLCLPTLALVYAFRRYPGGAGFPRCAAACIVSLVAIGLILYGLMPGSIDVAALFELTAVNALRLPFHSGVIVYAAATLLAFISAIALLRRGADGAASAVFALAVWLTGIFSFCGAAGSAALAIIAAIAFRLFPILRRRMSLTVWCLGMLWLGFTSYGVILIRGAAEPPINEGAPTDIFALKSYLGREQYGSKPLLRGPAAFSRPLKRERASFDGKEYHASYNETWSEARAPKFRRALAGASLLRAQSTLDSAEIKGNEEALARAAEGHDAYVAADARKRYRHAPELNMWLPRITASDLSEISDYTPWCGITPADLDSVRASTAVDSAGNAVGRLLPDGSREKEWKKRPTYLQNIRYMLQYQIGYMYMRYLMWNFSGRQNDRHSTGQANDGNFITGIPAVDDAMLGRQDTMPRRLGRDNPGRHEFYLIPFLLCLAGLGFQLAGGRRSRRAAAIIGSLFVMTGVVIVIYVNQAPSEPRERDYSYIGSFYAFALWGAAGAAALIRLAAGKGDSRLRRASGWCAALLALAVPAWMCASNLKDHDRSGRRITSDLAFDALAFLERDAILFVNGDNYTFPTWYIREVERARPDVRVVNIVYLGSTSYVERLLLPDRESAPLPMTATRADLAYDNVLISLYGAREGSPRTRKATEALRDLYARKGASTPRLDADTLLIGPSGGPALPLKAVASGKRFLSLGQLAMLDIVATNAVSPRPRPVYWINPLRPNHFAGLYNYTLDQGTARRYTGTEQRADSLDSSRFFRMLTSDGEGGMPRFRFGNAKGCYVDPTSANNLGTLRHSMILLARQLLGEGRTADALRIARLTETEIPDSTFEYHVFTSHYRIYSEATELARIYLSAGEKSGRDDLRRHGFRLLRKEIERLASWRRYVDSLPAWRRGVLSSRPGLESAQLYAPVKLWLEAGGSRDSLLAIPAIRGIDLEKESAKWEKNALLRDMLHAARYPMADSAEMNLYRRYRDCGGKASDLRPYREFDTSPYLFLLPE